MATRNPSLNIIPDLARKAGLTSNAGGLVDDELIGARGDWWYTGKHPEQCPGYDAKHGVLRSLALPSTNGCTRQQVLDYFDNCWTLTEVLFASLQVRHGCDVSRFSATLSLVSAWPTVLRT